MFGKLSFYIFFSEKKIRPPPPPGVGPPGAPWKYGNCTGEGCLPGPRAALLENTVILLGKTG